MIKILGFGKHIIPLVFFLIITGIRTGIADGIGYELEPFTEIHTQAESSSSTSNESIIGKLDSNVKDVQKKSMYTLIYQVIIMVNQLLFLKIVLIQIMLSLIK